MYFPRRHHFKRNDNRFRERRPERSRESRDTRELMNPEHAGQSEADYMKSLVDSRAKVTVVLRTGERLSGRIRYYDRYCFSLGLSAQGPRLFLRKASVSYISEE